MLNHYKVRINDQTMEGTTGLISACASSRVEVVKYLLRDANCRMYILEDTKVNGRNAFNAACSSGNMEIIQFLLGNGFDINLSRSFHHVNFDPVDYDKGNYKFHRRHCYSDTGLTAALRAHKYDVVEFLLSKGANPIYSVESIVGTYFDIEAFKHILDRTEDRKTLLTRAYLVACKAVVQDCHAGVKFVEYLVDNGVDVTAVDPVEKSNKTGLHVACYWRDNPYIGYNELLVKLLILHNSEIYNIKDKDGKKIIVQALHYTHSLYYTQVIGQLTT